MELSKIYNPCEVEDRIFKMWTEDGYFHTESDSNQNPFTIVIPPPNVTGVLHMGHALNDTIQDILIRKARMDGHNTRWVVGTDHAGIATQNVVERKLKEKKLTRHDLGREKFLDEVWKWKDLHGSTIINQLKKLGCSCDFEHERFTMDKGLAFAVRKCFVQLYEKGLVYRGEHIINWCPRCHTALSDEEAEHHDQEGSLYTFQYPYEDGSGFITVATTRPETLLGDTAVAVSPEDPRYRHLVGKKVVVPFVKRKIPIIADEWVDPAFGTGMVKVTPAHDPNDYEIGKRNNLEIINVMTPSGLMNEHAAVYQGMDRFECRKKILEDLKAKGLLLKVDTHAMAIRKCYRCATVVEPRISKQWFVRMKPLAEKALHEFYEHKRPRFTPQRFENIYVRWLEGIRDWCISRQIWWGHQIPVWYCEDCEGTTVSLEDSVKQCSKCGSSKVKQEEDVLDTWFSSWLWPFSTLGWPEKTADLDYFYPTQILVTAQEIIFFWVARMVMSGLEFTGKCPFQDVYIHGTVRDESGLKMSKSYGNVIDPLKIIEQFGSDSLRFSLMMVSSRGNDIYISDKKFEIGRNFATKIWNASRFMLMNMGERKLKVYDYVKYQDSFSPDDRLILRKTEEMIIEVDKTIKEFRFNDASLCLYEFFWTSFCDRYIESVKPYFSEQGQNNERSVAVLFHVLSQFLKCAHPVIPFITEELWQILRQIDPELSLLLASARYPEIKTLAPAEPLLQYTESKYEVIKSARNLRKQFNLAPSAEVNFIIKTEDESKRSFLTIEVSAISRHIKAASLKIDPGFKPLHPMPSEVTPLGVIYMELDKSYIDFEKEKVRIQKKIDEANRVLENISKKINNEKFVANAAPAIVEAEKVKYGEMQDELAKLKDILNFYSES